MLPKWKVIIISVHGKTCKTHLVMCQLNAKRKNSNGWYKLHCII